MALLLLFLFLSVFCHVLGGNISESTNVDMRNRPEHIYRFGIRICSSSHLTVSGSVTFILISGGFRSCYVW